MLAPSQVLLRAHLQRHLRQGSERRLQATPEMFLLHCAIVDPHLCYHCPHLGCFLRMLLLTHPHLVVMAAAACDICCHGLVAIVAATLEWSGYSCPRSHLGSCSHLGLFLLSCHFWPSSCHHRCYHLGHFLLVPLARVNIGFWGQKLLLPSFTSKVQILQITYI